MDHENYGKSGRTKGNADIASGVEDLKAAVEVVARETGQQKYHFCGESSGALRAGAFAMRRPSGWTGSCCLPTPTKARIRRPSRSAPSRSNFYRTHNMRKRDRAMIESIATRDKPGTSDPAVVKVLADVELQFGEEVPTGTYLDMTANLPVCIRRRSSRRY